MWTQVYDDHGVVLKGAWATFQHEIKREHKPVVKIEFLNANMKPVKDNIVSGLRGQVQNVVSDGNIDVDTTRGTRRTAELTLLNPTAEFTPGTEGFEPEGRWTGEVYLNRFVRIWKGVQIQESRLWVPVGTFMIDTCEVMVEQNMSLVNITMSDFWKKIAKSYWGAAHKYERGTLYLQIIRDILDGAGIGHGERALDDLDQRDVADRKTDNKVEFKRGESRGDRLKELAKHWGLDVYFDPMGKFRLEDRRSEEDKAEVWTFKSRTTDDGKNGGLISLTRSFNDDNLYNHVIIIGTGKEKQIVRAAKEDNNPESKTNIDTIGDRVYFVETDRISTQNEANRALRRAWSRRFNLSEKITCETICNPALEGDDVIRIEERDFAKIDGRYRLLRFNVPLVTSRSTVEVANIVRESDV